MSQRGAQKQKFFLERYLVIIFTDYFTDLRDHDIGHCEKSLLLELNSLPLKLVEGIFLKVIKTTLLSKLSINWFSTVLVELVRNHSVTILSIRIINIFS
jgi:hypothetical protein